MSDERPTHTKDATAEELDFFELFAELRKEFPVKIENFSTRVVRYIEHHHDDFRTQNPDMSNMLTTSLTTVIRSFLSIWDDPELAKGSEKKESPDATPPREPERSDEEE